jgi:hypothetical protein
VSTRKPILVVDDSDDSRAAIELFIKKSIDYVEYRLDKFAGTCCGGGNDDDSNTSKIKAPAVFAPEGVQRPRRGRKILQLGKKIL